MGVQDPYLGEIVLFAGNFPPRGWAFCDGSILPISQNTALFSLLGTFYGGNGISTFALPDLRGRTPIHSGQIPGGQFRNLGERGGQESVPLQTSQIPAHAHNLAASSASATTTSPSGQGFAASPSGVRNYGTPQNTGPLTTLAPTALALTGGSQPHNNMQPSLAINYIIALQGVFPPRS